MTQYRHGIYVEKMLRVLLMELGCQLKQSETLDHQYKLDFVVEGFRNITGFRFPPVGVQLKTNPHDGTGLRAFMDALERGTCPTESVLYLVIPEAVNLEHGGAVAVFGMLLTMAFNRDFQRRHLAAQVHPDFSWQFHELPAYRAQLESKQKRPALSQTPKVATGAPPPRSPRALTEHAPTVQLANVIPSEGTHLNGHVAAIGDGRRYFFIRVDGYCDHYANPDECSTELLEVLADLRDCRKTLVKVEFESASPLRGHAKPRARALTLLSVEDAG